MKNLLAKTIIAVSLLAGLSQFAESSELRKTKDLRVLGEVGVVNGNMTGGVSVKRNKYTADIHVGKGTTSVGVARELLKLESLSLGAGLSANKTEVTKGKIRSIRTYQAFDLNIENKFKNNMSIRGSINTNGDFKAGFGWSF